MRMKQFIKKFYYIPSASLNISAKSNLAKMNFFLNEFKNPIVLNIGSGERFIGEESLNSDSISIVNLDISLSPSIDVLGDAHKLPFGNATFQGIVCQAVLEHTRDPEIIIEEIHRILQKRGILYVEVPFLQGFHPNPTDYYRYTLEGIKYLFSGFFQIDSGVCVGPSSALSWLFREYISGLLTGFSEKKYARLISVFFAGWLTFPIKYLDAIIARRPGAHRISSGLYYLGRKY